MRLLVCGGRDYSGRDEIFAVLDGMPVSVVISGLAPGADTLAIQWAHSRKISLLCFPANWKAHGKAAGPIRNQKMLDEGKPDLVLAFPGGRGTADMVRRAKQAGVTVVERLN